MLGVEVTPRALAQLERAARWWAAKLLALQPGIGTRSASAKYPELRSLQLDRVRYDIYYDVRPGKVVGLAFWHSSRGSAPKL